MSVMSKNKEVLDESEIVFKESCHETGETLFTYHNVSTIHFSIDDYEKAKLKFHEKGYGFGLFDINGYVSLDSSNIKSLDIPFNEVFGNFDVSNNELKNLYSGPKVVNGIFDVRANRLKSLEFGPNFVASNYICSNNSLLNLKHSPKYIYTNFDCSYNHIKSFENCPEKITGCFNINNNQITSLVGIHKHLKRCSILSILENNIQEGGIGLLLIENLKNIIVSDWSGTDIHWGSKNRKEIKNLTRAMNIIIKYLPSGKAGLLACQEELIEEKLEKFAIL